MENGFSSSRNEGFPAGLRVLVVDDDPTWLKILEKMLKKCSYEVTTCGLARDALNLLRERKDGYDIVISDVNMPDMDGFKLLEHVGLEMDLPVIMMSVDGETSRVMKGVQHGACDYLLKPIRMKELRNIWQHVFRKRIHEVRDIELLEGMESIQMTRNAFDQHDDVNLLYGDDLTSLRKRKDTDSKHDDKNVGDNFSTKKARVVWSVDLHQKFVKAVNQIGYDKVGPKKILDLMNVPWLTRENVASHLQKYRLYLSRLQKENDQKSSVSLTKQSDSPCKDYARNVGIHNSISIPQSEVSNHSYGYSSSSVLVHNVDSQSNNTDINGIVSVPAAQKQVSNVNISESCLVGSAQPEYRCPFTPIKPEHTGVAFNSSMPIQYSWRGIEDVQPKQEQQKLHSIDNDLVQLLLPVQQQQIHADSFQPSLPSSSGLSLPERGMCSPTKNSSLYGKQRSNTNQSPVEIAVNSGQFQSKPNEENHQAVNPNLTDTASFRNLGLNVCHVADLDSSEKNLNQGMPSLPYLDEDLQVHWLQGDCCAPNLGLNNIEFPEYYNTESITELPVSFYGTWSDCDYIYDSSEYPIDQGLFIV